MRGETRAVDRRSCCCLFANTQAATLEETRANLREAVTLVVETNRMFAREDATGDGVIREPL
jgi:hypothetical protein